MSFRFAQSPFSPQTTERDWFCVKLYQWNGMRLAKHWIWKSQRKPARRVAEKVKLIHFVELQSSLVRVILKSFAFTCGIFSLLFAGVVTFYGENVNANEKKNAMNFNWTTFFSIKAYLFMGRTATACGFAFNPTIAPADVKKIFLCNAKVTQASDCASKAFL